MSQHFIILEQDSELFHGRILHQVPSAGGPSVEILFGAGKTFRPQQCPLLMGHCDLHISGKFTHDICTLVLYVNKMIY